MPEMERHYCIYTMRDSSVLKEKCTDGGTGRFTEQKRWIEGKRLFIEAKKSSKQLPIVFSAAEKDSGLLYYAFLTDVAPTSDDKGTIYSFKGLTPIKGEPPKSTLRLKSTGKPLSNKFIRPYAICYKPAFIK